MEMIKNVYSQRHPETLDLTVKLTLERAISYIQDDELVEITPNVIRLRKKYLDMHERKRQSRKSSAV